jgi:hypothetical protein
MIIFEHFGASIDEHHGEGYSKSAINGDKTEDEEESWWMKRRKKTKELLEEQQLKAAREAKAKEAADLQESSVEKTAESACVSYRTVKKLYAEWGG